MNSDSSWLAVPGTVGFIHENWLFSLRSERFRSRISGKEHDFFVMSLADSVNVIAVTPENQVIMVKQFRAGSNRDGLELPGGLLEPGEDPLEAGIRELLEETGHAGDPPRVVIDLFAVPSLLTSRSVTILVTNALRVAEMDLDASEEMTLEYVPLEEISTYLKDGRIHHALTAVGLLSWQTGF